MTGAGHPVTGSDGGATASRALSFIAGALQAESVELLPEPPPDAPDLIFALLPGRPTCLVARRGARPFDDGERRLLDVSAGLLSVQLDVAREIASHQARMEELIVCRRDLEEISYGASHDLQEPLRMVGVFAQLLAKQCSGQLGTQADEFIRYILTGVSRMGSLIHDLSEYSRVIRESQAVSMTNSEDALRFALANLKSAIAESGASVTHGVLPSLPASALHLGQVFQNLIDNAIKFRSAEPLRIHIAAERTGPEWRFSVADNGIGIDPRHSDWIFGVFTRLHGNDHPGSGIGLAVCRRIVLRHGGRMWVESELARGATFYFTIPAA